MKKLSNVSPFLLLLFPVLVVMLLAFATNSTNNQNEEVALKNNASNQNIAKVATEILK